MSTATTMSAAIGQRYRINLDGLTIEVEVRDCKFAYGRTRVLVVPVHGTGETWVDAQRLQPK